MKNTFFTSCTNMNTEYDFEKYCKKQNLKGTSVRGVIHIYEKRRLK